MCEVVTGAFAAIKALSGHAFKLAFVDFLPMPLVLPGVSVHDCVCPAVSAVSGDGRAADGDIGGGLGRHGDQFRRCEESVRKVLIPEVFEGKATAASKEEYNAMGL